MKIEVLYSPGCPHYVTVTHFIHEILAETGIAAQIELIPVETEEQARLEEMANSAVTCGLDGAGGGVTWVWRIVQTGGSWAMFFSPTYPHAGDRHDLGIACSGPAFTCLG